jgi:hypothetical protein
MRGPVSLNPQPPFFLSSSVAFLVFVVLFSSLNDAQSHLPFFRGFPYTMLCSLLMIVPFLAGVFSSNDWNTPCINGQCSYGPYASCFTKFTTDCRLRSPHDNWLVGHLENRTSIVSVATHFPDAISQWGSDNVITDITPAADWQILDCNRTALSQNLRLVCMNDDPSSLCAHLYKNAGAANKIVRLPENVRTR